MNGLEAFMMHAGAAAASPRRIMSTYALRD